MRHDQQATERERAILRAASARPRRQVVEAEPSEAEIAAALDAAAAEILADEAGADDDDPDTLDEARDPRPSSLLTAPRP